MRLCVRRESGGVGDDGEAVCGDVGARSDIRLVLVLDDGDADRDARGGGRGGRGVRGDLGGARRHGELRRVLEDEREGAGAQRELARVDGDRLPVLRDVDVRIGDLDLTARHLEEGIGERRAGV